MSEFKHNDCKNTTIALFSKFMKTVRINLQELQQFSVFRFCSILPAKQKIPIIRSGSIYIAAGFSPLAMGD